MKLITLKCPNCGGKLKTEDDKKQVVCIHCGYEFLIEKSQPTIHNHYYGTSSNTPRRASAPPVEANPKGAVKVIVFIIVICFILFIILPSLMSSESSTSSQTVTTSSSAVFARTIPQSEPMQLFVEYLFNKPYKTLTADDYSQLKYLDINNEWNVWIFSYSFSDYKTTENFEDTIKTIQIPHEDDIDRKDIQIFAGLTSLRVNGNYFSQESTGPFLVSSPYLTSLDTSNLVNLYNTPLLVEDVSQLEHLSVKLLRNEDVVEVLQYTNLKSLYINTLQSEVTNVSELGKLNHLTTLHQDHSDNIKWISSIPTIKNLTIFCNQITDFSVLYGLPQIESLKIESARNLKNIDFVKNMPNLKSFCLSDSTILTIAPLSGSKSLQKLQLYDNSNLTSVPELATLTSLKELEIIKYNLVGSDLSTLTHLETLTIYNSNISVITALPSVKNLTILMKDSSMDFSIIPDRFPNTELLTLKETATAYNMDALVNLKKLKTLQMDGPRSSSMEDSTYLFTHPTIEHLVLERVSLRLDDNKFPENTVLKSLSMSSDIDFYKPEKRSARADFSDFPHLLESFPNMEELYLSGLKITSLDFILKMPNLRVANLEDNYLSDISPLTKLKNLDTLLLQNNTIANEELLDDDIHLLTGNLKK